MRLFLYILILSFLSINCKAQSTTKKIKGKEFTYEIKTTLNSERIKISNIKDTVESKKIKYDGDAKIDFNNNNEINQIFLEVFNQKLDIEKIKNESLAIGFLINQKGEIKSLDFFMNESLLKELKIENIEILEKELKKKINPQIINFNKNATYAYYNFILKFKDLKY